MRESTDNRRPEEIESDIERTRADFSSTIDAIQSKLTPGQLMDQAVSYARTSLPADFGANLGNAVRDNPVPVALIGVGLAWLMASGRNADGRARLRRIAAERSDYLYSEPMSDYDGMHGASHMSHMDSGSDSALHRAAAKTDEAGRNLKDKAGDLKDKAAEAGQVLKNKASEIGSRISGSTSALSGRAHDLSQDARDRIQGSVEGARARVGEIGQRSQQQYYRAKDSVGHLLDEQPLVLGAIGIAIGALLGATLPRTRREDELMGSTRDDLLDQAKKTAREQAEKLREPAQRVAQVAKQEVERTAAQVSSAATQGSNQVRQDNRSGSSATADSTPFDNMPAQTRPH